MARILSVAQAAALAGKRRQEFWRVLTADPDGAEADLSDLAGRNWIEGGDLDDGIDQPIMGATIRLRRDHGALSLSPLREDSTLNRDAADAYAPFLDVGRWIAVECQVVDPAVTAVPIAGDWIRLFEGSIDSVDPATDTIVILARDKGAALADSWLPTPTAAVVAGDAPVPVEEVIQGMLDTALGAGNVTLYTPVSPLYESTRFGYQRETVSSAIQRLVESFGWDCRYRWDAGTSSFRLTLFQPPRAKVDPDITLTRYRSLKKFAVSRMNIRNTVRIYYSDPVGGRHNVFHNDADSQLRYGTRPIIIEEASDSTISSDLEADTMALALLADLKDPGSDGECDSPLLPQVELNDLVRLPPNAIHFNTNQDLAVVGVKHSFSSSAPSSTVLTLRGRPAGAYRSWLRRGGPPITGGGVSAGIERPFCWFESSNQSGLIETVTFNGNPGHNAPASPFMWHTRETARGDVGDWTPWSEAALPIEIEIARDPLRATQLEGEVLQADGQVWHADWTSAGAPPGLDDTTGHVDPTKPLSGTVHFIPRATDINGMQLDPGTKDSRTAPLNGMFRYGTDGAAGVLEDSARWFINPGFVDGSRRPINLHDNVLGTDVGVGGAQGFNDGRLRAVSAIDGAQNGTLLSAAKDSRSAPLNNHFRYGTDSAAGVLEDSARWFIDPNFVDGSRRPITLHDSVLGTDISVGGAGGFNDTRYRAIGAIADQGGTLQSAAKDSRSAPLNNHFRYGSDTLAGVLDGSGWQRTTPTQVSYADRAGTGLDTSGYVQTGIKESATIGPVAASRIARSMHGLFLETFEGASLAWTKVAGNALTSAVVAAGAGAAGGNAMHIAYDGWYRSSAVLPYDATKLHRITTAAKLLVGSAGAGKDGYFCGVTCYNAAMDELGTCWIAAFNTALVAGAYQPFVGFFKGTSAGGTNYSPDASAPGTLLTGTAYIRPMVIGNYDASTGDSLIDYVSISVQDEDAAARVYSGLTTAGDVKGLAFNATGGSKNIVRGGKTGTCKHGDVVVFPATANLPAVILTGGVDYQPENKWGTEGAVDAGTASSAPTAGKAQYRDFQALNLTHTSFTVRARKRIKAAGSSTQTYDFAANNLTAAGQQTADVTLAAGRSSTGQYTVRYDVALAVQCTGPGSATITVVVAIEIDNGSGSFVEAATATHQLTSFAGDGGQSSSDTFTLAASATVTGTNGKIRLRLKSLSFTGVHAVTDGAAVHGHTASDSGHGIEYPLSTGDLFTSATPDADDGQGVRYTIVEI